MAILGPYTTKHKAVHCVPQGGNSDAQGISHRATKARVTEGVWAVAMSSVFIHVMRIGSTRHQMYRASDSGGVPATWPSCVDSKDPYAQRGCHGICRSLHTQ